MLIKFAIKDFIDDRQLKNLSTHTIAGYQRTLGEFHQFCVDNGVVDTGHVTHSLVTVRTLDEFHEFCVDRKLVDFTDVTPVILTQYFLLCQVNRLYIVERGVSVIHLFFTLEKRIRRFVSENGKSGDTFLSISRTH